VYGVAKTRPKPQYFRMTSDSAHIVRSLSDSRKQFKRDYPKPRIAELFIDRGLAILFPHFDVTIEDTASSVESLLAETQALLAKLCSPVMPDETATLRLTGVFTEELPSFHRIMLEDAQAIYQGDPAAHSIDEVILAYPGFYAIAVYRLAHWFLRQGVPLVPRLLSEVAHTRTGIDIHPGADIGRSFVIDHGTGIVIGETTTIRDHVKLYQGVTLGALSVDKGLTHTKRHPTIESDVVIYANATILGGETIIGSGSVIGGNVWLTASVPAGSRVYHRSDVTVK
jgi:serine O-acetyltransferase